MNNNSSKPIIIIALTTMVIILLVMGITLAYVLSEKSNDTPEPSATVAPTETVVVNPTSSPTAPPTQTVAPQPVQTTSNTIVVSTMYVVNCNEWISLRSTPNTNASRLATIPLGSSVGFIEQSTNGFYKIAYNGVVGYALSQYLSASPAHSSYVPSAPSTAKMTVVDCNEWISLRSTPSTNASRIAEIPLGATVEFLEVSSNGFYKVRYNGAVGYALSQYLR